MEGNNNLDYSCTLQPNSKSTDHRKILHTCSGHANVDTFLVPAVPAGVPVAGIELAHLLLLTEVRVKLLEGAPEKLLQKEGTMIL